jgi:hypothetical protein
MTNESHGLQGTKIFLVEYDVPKDVTVTEAYANLQRAEDDVRSWMVDMALECEKPALADKIRKGDIYDLSEEFSDETGSSVSITHSVLL